MAQPPLRKQKDMVPRATEYYWMGANMAGDLAPGELQDHLEGDVKDMEEEIKEDKELMKRLSGIDDGMIGNREMEHGVRDVGVMRVQPTVGDPTNLNDQENNRRDESFEHSETGVSPTALDAVEDGPRMDAVNLMEPTEYPDEPGGSHHDEQMSINPPFDATNEEPDNPKLRKNRYIEASIKADEVLPMLLENPGYPHQVGRKTVPTGEGGAVGIPGVDGSSPHAVDVVDEADDQFRGGQPSSNTVTDEFEMPKQRGQVTRPINGLHRASVEIFAPVDGDDLFEGEGF